MVENRIIGQTRGGHPQPLAGNVLHFFPRKLYWQVLHLPYMGYFQTFAKGVLLLHIIVFYHAVRSATVLLSNFWITLVKSSTKLLKSFLCNIAL